jgi:drug/metabolite transporter (DMT)-like permease
LPDRLIRRWNSLTGNVRGSILIIIGTFVGTLMVSCIKVLGQRIPVVEILFMRQVVLLLVIAPMMVRNFPGVFVSRHRKLHFIRVGVSSIAMITGFTAFVHLPLAEATTIGFARTLFTTVLAVLILHETVGLRRWSATALGFIGVVVVVQPGSDSFSLYALAAILSAFLVALLMIFLRTLSQVDKPITIMSYQAVFLTLILAAPALYFWVTPTWTELVLVIVAGTLMSVMQWLNIQAYKVGEAAAIAPMDYFRLFFATLIGIWFFSEIPTIWTFVGAGIILLSTAYTMHRNSIRKSAAPATPEAH